MKINTRNEESDIKVKIIDGCKALGWNLKIDKAMQKLNNKPDVAYSIETEGTDIIIRYWLEDEVQSNHAKMLFISQTFREIVAKFAPINCQSKFYYKDLWKVFRKIREEEFRKRTQTKATLNAV